MAVAQEMTPLEDVPEGSAFAIDANRDIFVMVCKLDAFIRRTTQNCCGIIGTDHIVGRCACAIRSISSTLSAADIACSAREEGRKKEGGERVVSGGGDEG